MTSFQANQELIIEGTTYCIAEHPNAPGMPYGQEGRAATVGKLDIATESRALKVFKSRFRMPSLVSLSKNIAQYSTLPGLRVCERAVLTPQKHTLIDRC